MEVEISHQCLWSSWLVANKIVEHGRCLHAVVNDSICESGSDTISMRSRVVDPATRSSQPDRTRALALLALVRSCREYYLPR